MATEWIVVLEAADDGGGDSFDLSAFHRLLDAVADANPSALYNPDRYALQLVVKADGAPEALLAAISRWRGALRRTGLPKWSLARTEVITPWEFERECRAQATADSVAGAPALADDGQGERDAAEDDLLRRAFHDSLTRLASRELFRDYVEHALARRDRAGTARSVLVVDLDGFGKVVDSRGGPAGDDVLVTAAQRILGSVRAGDVVARLGRDEFAVLLECSSSRAASGVAQRIVAALGQPTSVAGDEVEVTASVGVAVSRPEESADDLIRRAAVAMCRAKWAGGNRHAELTAGGDLAELDLSRLDHEPHVGAEDRGLLALLMSAGSAANECPTLADAARVVIRQVCAHTGWPLGRLAQPAPGDQSPADIWHAAVPDRFRWFQAACDAQTDEVTGGLVAMVRSTALPAAVDVGDPAFPLGQEAAEVGIKAAYAFPVLSGQEVAAVLVFYSDRARAHETGVVEVLASVGIQLGRVAERGLAVSEPSAASLASADRDRRRVASRRSGLSD